jgi:hypothetical protein
MAPKLILLTLNLLTTTIVAPPSNARKWQMGFNLAFKGLMSSNSRKKEPRYMCLSKAKASDSQRMLAEVLFHGILWSYVM